MFLRVKCTFKTKNKDDDDDDDDDDFCILMIFIDFQFYIQFYDTLLSLTTLLHSLHTHTPLHHLFYIVNNFFSHIRTAAVQNCTLLYFVFAPLYIVS